MEQYKDAKTEASSDQVCHLMVGKASGSHFFSLSSVHYCGLGFICESELLTSSGTKDCLLVCPSQRPRTVLADMVGVFLHIHVIVIYKYTILCICQMLFSEQLRALYPPLPRCWLRKSSRVD